MFRLPRCIQRFLEALLWRRPSVDPDRLVRPAKDLHVKLPEVLAPIRRLERQANVRVSDVELTIVNHADPDRGTIRVLNSRSANPVVLEVAGSVAGSLQ